MRLRSRERPEGASGSTEVAARAANGVSEQDRLPVVLCGAGGTQRGSREGEARRSKHRKERVKRATEERSKAREPSRLGLWMSPSQQR